MRRGQVLESAHGSGQRRNRVEEDRDRVAGATRSSQVPHGQFVGCIFFQTHSSPMKKEFPSPLAR